MESAGVIWTTLLRATTTEWLIRRNSAGSSWAAMRYSSDHIFDYIQLTGDHSIYETAVPPSWVGKTIGQLGVRQRYSINVLATKRGEKLMPIPGGDHCFQADETILILGANKDVQKFLNF